MTSDAPNELKSSEKILLHAKTMYKEVSKEEMKVLHKVDEKKHYEYFANRYNELHSIYPALFNLLIYDADKFDMSRLTEMLRIRDQIENKEITTETASEQIGQKYFKEFCSDKVMWKKEKNGK